MEDHKKNYDIIFCFPQQLLFSTATDRTECSHMTMTESGPQPEVNGFKPSKPCRSHHGKVSATYVWPQLLPQPGFLSKPAESKHDQLFPQDNRILCACVCVLCVSSLRCQNMYI